MWHVCILLICRCLGVQKKYNTPQEHKDGMLSYLKAWNAPRIKSLIAQTPSETILLSHIYERYLPCPFTGVIWALWASFSTHPGLQPEPACVQLADKASSLLATSDGYL